MHTAQIKQIFSAIPELQGQVTTIEEIKGGLTNTNYRVQVGEQQVFVSLPGAQARLLGVDIKNKVHNHQVCAELGISPKLIHFDPDHGLIVSQHIPFKPAQRELLHNPTKRQQILHTLKTLHYGPRFQLDFDMGDLIQHYLSVIKYNKYALPSLYTHYSQILNTIAQALALPPEERKPCHNDLVFLNVLPARDKIFFVDFDYSGNNDPCFDLGMVCEEAKLSAEKVADFVSDYYGRIDQVKIARTHLQMILMQFGWSLWAIIRFGLSQIDADYHHFVDHRWTRAVEKIKQTDTAELIGIVQKSKGDT